MATMAEALADIEDEFENIDESFCVLDDDPGIRNTGQSTRGGGRGPGRQNASAGRHRERAESGTAQNGRYGKWFSGNPGCRGRVLERYTGPGKSLVVSGVLVCVSSQTHCTPRSVLL